MSTTNANPPESQFQKVGDIVEREDDLGVVEVESLCMNCHENVWIAPSNYTLEPISIVDKKCLCLT